MKLLSQVSFILIAICSAYGYALAGCNDVEACNYNLSDTDDLGCCYTNCLQIEITSGSFDSEVSWNIYDEEENILLSGGANTTVTECLESGCYLFEGLDSFGDGWNGATFSISLNEIVINSGTVVGLESIVHVFVASAPTELPCYEEGCMNSLACNFSASANVDDGSCELLSCYGCMDSSACNFDSALLYDDGSCNYECYGCTSEEACNWGGVEITIDDESCCFESCVEIEMIDSFGDGWTGATYEITDRNSGDIISSGTLLSGTFDIDVLCLDQGCFEILVGGGTFDNEISWNLLGADGGDVSGIAGEVYVFTVDGGECLGCTDATACNYTSWASIDDGSCCGDDCATLTVGGGFEDEISWILYDEMGSVVSSGGAPFSEVVCMPTGCYEMEMSDAFGDGWVNGQWTLFDMEGNVQHFGTLNNGNGPVVDSFAYGGNRGCMDSSASNYLPGAICGDGTCVYCPEGSLNYTLHMEDSFGDGWNGAHLQIRDIETQEVMEFVDIEDTQVGNLSMGEYHFCLPIGCYEVELDSGEFPDEISWTLYEFGNTVIFEGGAPFNAMGFSTFGSDCEIFGCMDMIAWNYNPNANMDDGSCVLPPPNDLCENAELLVCGTTVIGTIVDATLEEFLEGASCGSSIDTPGVWYKYEGDGTQINVSSCDTVYYADTEFSLFYTSTNCDSLVCIGGAVDAQCTGFSAEMSFLAEEGFDYYLYVHMFGTWQTPFSLTTSCIDCNVEHENISSETAEELELGVTTMNSLCCLNPSEPDVCTPSFSTPYGMWYVVNSGEVCNTFIFELINVSSSSVGMTFFEDEGDELVEIACCPLVQDYCTGDLSSFVVLSPNTDYYLSVYTTNPSGCGEFELTVGCGVVGCINPVSLCFDPNANVKGPCCPGECEVYIPNDLCEDAIELSCGDEFYHSLQCSTEDDAPLLVDGCDISPGAGVWFWFEGTGQVHTIRTCDGGANNNYSLADTEINIFTTTTGDCSGTFLCAQDAVLDFYLAEEDDDQTNFDCGYFQSDDVWMDFVSELGEIYFVYVSGTQEHFRIAHDCTDAIVGCTEVGADNYNPEANYNDKSCQYFTYLCEDCEVYNTPVEFYMTDAFGDGWTGAIYTVEDEFGNVVVTGDIDNALYGEDVDVWPGNDLGSDFFCLCGQGCYTITVGGGTFDSEIGWALLEEDGTVLAEGGAGIEVVYCQNLGCMDSTACNFNSISTIDDGSCIPSGCYNPEALNYEPDAACGGGVCLIFGDMNADEIVDVQDLLIFLGQFGCIDDCLGDLNEDGIVNVFDLLILLGII